MLSGIKLTAGDILEKTNKGIKNHCQLPPLAP